VISAVCHVLNYLSGSKVGGLPIYVFLLPFVLILIPLLTVDKDYWNRIKGKTLIAPLFLLDFVNYPSTAIAVVATYALQFFIGYMHRYCILVWQ
jgi:hypothetical protein